ncbi:MAG: Fe-S cluster assembly protein SufD [Betaproteobacteria bacterium]|nr:Fe-S cluster assembly protein SufD [Betaproteobacteria bacterium]
MDRLARERYLAEFSELEARLPGTRLPWLAKARRDALERFAETGFPTTRNEDWKYTNVAAIEKRPFPAARVAAADDAVARRAGELALDGAYLMVFVDGHLSLPLSRVTGLPTGVAVQGLAETLEARSDLVEALLAGESCSNGFEALNLALMADGAVIYLPRGVALERPVHVLYLATRDGTASHIRNLILAEDGSEATVIEHYAALNGTASFTNAVTRIRQGNNARVEHIKLQQESPKAYHVAAIQSLAGRDSRFTSHSIALGAALSRNDISTRLDDENAECHLNGLYMAGGRQHVDHHTRIDHAKPRGVSREYYRGVLDGAARAVFNGKVVVHADAQHTDAHQSNNNLLLSREAEVDTKPQLEIFADDVKCTHGATVGQLDPDMLFYLRSRGMEEAQARSLLTYAFAEDVITRIKVAPLRARIEEFLIHRLPEGGSIKELL